MNRRRFLAGVGGGAVALSVGYGGVRVADVRPYDPDLPSGDTPRERIVAAAAHRFAADHRMTSRTRVLRDWMGEAPYDLERYRQWHEHSRRRHLHALTTFDCPLTRNDRLRETPSQEFVSPTQTLYALLHYNRVFSPDPLPQTLVMHLTDGMIRFDYDAPTPTSEDGRVDAGDVEVSPDKGYTGVTDTDTGVIMSERVRPNRADWEQVDESADAVTYRVEGADDYAQVVPLTMAPITEFGDPWAEVTLDRETGVLRRLVDHRDATYDLFEDGDPVRLTYRIETTFDEYGTATAPRPGGDFDAAFDARGRAFLLDLLTY